MCSGVSTAGLAKFKDAKQGARWRTGLNSFRGELHHRLGDQSRRVPGCAGLSGRRRLGPPPDPLLRDATLRVLARVVAVFSTICLC